MVDVSISDLELCRRFGVFFSNLTFYINWQTVKRCTSLQLVPDYVKIDGRGSVYQPVRQHSVFKIRFSQPM